MRRRKAFFLWVLLAVSVSLAHSQSLTFRLGGGLSYAGGGDLANGIKGQTEYLRADFNISGEFMMPTSGLNFEGEFAYYFGSKLGLGLGFGYSRHAKESVVSYDLDVISIQETFSPKFSVMPITANLHYLWAVSPGFRIDLMAGAGYYIATLDWDQKMDMEVMGFKETFAYTFKATKGTIGLQAGLGLEMKIAPRTALVWTFVGRYASVSEFKGDWTDKGAGELLWNYEDSGSGHYAWSYDLTYAGKTYAQLAFDSDKPAGSNFSDVRYAKLDLTGFVTTLGIKFGF